MAKKYQCNSHTSHRALRTILKNLTQGEDELEIWGRPETLQSLVLLRSATEFEVFWEIGETFKPSAISYSLCEKLWKSIIIPFPWDSITNTWLRLTLYYNSPNDDEILVDKRKILKPKIRKMCTSPQPPPDVTSLQMTLFRHTSLLFIIRDTGSRQHPVSAELVYAFTKPSIRLGCNKRSIFYAKFKRFDFRVFLLLNRLPSQG